jgi:hypothetical protein
VSGRGSLYPAHKQIDERPHIRVTFDTSDLAQARSLGSSKRQMRLERSAQTASGADSWDPNSTPSIPILVERWPCSKRGSPSLTRRRRHKWRQGKIAPE